MSDELVVEFEFPKREELEVEFQFAQNGTNDHTLLINRDKEDQHPISAITDLQDTLDSKQTSLTEEQLAAVNSGVTSEVVAKANSALQENDNITKLNNNAGYITSADIPIQQQSNWTETDDTKVDYIKNKPTLATVATSGSYNDLSNKPTIPTVNDATITINQNGVEKGSFTLNQSTSETITLDSGISNIADGEGVNSLRQTGNSSLGTNSSAFGEGTIAAGKWSFAEGRGNNFDVTCVNSSTASFVIVNGEKANEIRKNAVIFCNNTFRYVTSVVNSYASIPQQDTPPVFEQNKYYDLEGSTYVLLTSEPSGWQYYYINYYYINGYNLSLDDYITYSEGDTVNVFMGAALASASHTEGNFCNTVYLDSTTLIDEDEVQRNSAEGSRTLATGYAAKAIGEYTRAIGRRSFASGNNSFANGSDSVALNHETRANARYSTALGDNTIAGCDGGLAAGRYNAGSSSGLFEVGNGTSSSRHTAFEVNTNGKAYSYSEPTPSDSENVVLNIKGLKNFIAIQKELTTQNEVDLAFGSGFYKVVNVATMPQKYGEMISIQYVGGNGINQYGAQIFFPNGDSTNRNNFWYRTCNGATQSGSTITPNWNNWQQFSKPNVINEYHATPASVTHENIEPNTTYILGYVSKLAFSIKSTPSTPEEKVIFNFITSPQGTPVLVYQGGSETWYDYAQLPPDTPVTITCEYRDSKWVATTNLNGGDRPITAKPTYNWTLRKSFNTSSHQLEDNVYQCVTPMIPVTGGQSITFTTSKQIIEYDSNGNYIDYWGGSNQFPNSRTITLHNNTTQIRLVTEMCYISQCWVQQNGQYLFRATDYADFYLPFVGDSIPETNLFKKINGYSSSSTQLLQNVDGEIQYSNNISASLVSGLATVATSGSYNDLSNKPTIPTVNNATLTIQKNGTTVNTFTANASSDVTANITVPTDTSDLTNNAGYITGITSSDVTTALGYTPYDSSNPNGYTTNTGTVTSVNNTSPDDNGNVTISIPAAQVQSNWTESDNTKVDYIKNKPNLATVATSGSYNDLSNKPTIPSAQVNSDWNASSGVAEILNKPTLATVATSGSYSDLSNKPTIPTTTDSVTSGSTAALTSGGAYTALSNKQDTLPSQSGNNGKFLGTDGTNLSWQTVDALPSQTGQSGKFLTTNGTTASWAEVQGGGSSNTIYTFTNNTGTTLDTQITLDEFYMVYKNGVLLTENTDYTVSGAVLTFGVALQSSDIITVMVGNIAGGGGSGSGASTIYSAAGVPQTTATVDGETINIGLSTTTTVTSSNVGLTVTCSYTGTKSTVGIETLIFTYDGSNWKDSSSQTVNLVDYDITVTGTPSANDTITLTYTTINKLALNNPTAIYPIVETYVSGTEWYNVYSNKWCEQGGVIDQSSSAWTPVYFLKPFADANYTVQATLNVSSTSNAKGAEVNVYIKSKDECDITLYNSYGRIAWTARGYIE